jgi:hypothetical protein
MAGRIRTIKPELMEDANTAGLSHAAFRLFVGMILLADDHGNLRAAPRWLEGQVFHGWELGDLDGNIAGLLAEIGRRLVTFYTVDGQPYAHLNGWTKHQRIDNAGKPRVPPPPGWKAHEEKRTEGNRERVRWIMVPIGAAPIHGGADVGGESSPPQGVGRLDLDHDLDHRPGLNRPPRNLTANDSVGRVCEDGDTGHHSETTVTRLRTRTGSGGGGSR